MTTPPPGPHQPGQPPAGYFPQYAPVVQRPTSGQAVASLILGIISVLGGAFLLIPPILAVLLGHAARHDTAGDNPSKGGHGAAVGGLFLGYLCLAPWAFFAGSLLIGWVGSLGG